MHLVRILTWIMYTETINHYHWLHSKTFEAILFSKKTGRSGDDDNSPVNIENKFKASTTCSIC